MQELLLHESSKLNTDDLISAEKRLSDDDSIDFEETILGKAKKPNQLGTQVVDKTGLTQLKRVHERLITEESGRISLDEEELSQSQEMSAQDSSPLHMRKRSEEHLAEFDVRDIMKMTSRRNSKEHQIRQDLL